MGAAYVTSDGEAVTLDRAAEPDEVVTAMAVQDPQLLARTIQRLLKDVATLKRAWTPRRTWFRDMAVDGTGTSKYLLQHGYGGRVNWYVAQWDPTAAGTECRLDQHADTSDDELVLVSGAAGTVTVLVEEAG